MYVTISYTAQRHFHKIRGLLKLYYYKIWKNKHGFNMRLASAWYFPDFNRNRCLVSACPKARILLMHINVNANLYRKGLSIEYQQ